MNKRRYDDVVRFVASIMFGTSFREFHRVSASLENLKCVNHCVAFATTGIFFAVFFRNVHGLIAYDLWVEHSQHEHAPSFEQKTRHIVLNFIFAFMGAILVPYIFIFNMAGDTINHDHIFFRNAELVTAMLFSPMLAYFIWNIFLLYTLRKNSLFCSSEEYQRNFSPISWFPWPSYLRALVLRKAKSVLDEMPLFTTKTPTETDWNRFRAYVDMLDFTILWILIDLLLLVAIFLGSLIISLTWPGSFYHQCIMYLIFAIVVLLLDYSTHVEYYFPTPFSPREFYEFGPVWKYVLPDGPRFCHWGGKKSSENIVKKLEVTANDVVIELCCGQGGALSLLPSAKLIVGVDRSSLAIKEAKKHLGDKPIELTCADVHQLPFPDNFFSKLFVQDGDVWMHPMKHALMSKIFKVTAKNGMFIYQDLVCRSSIPEEALRKTERILKKCGYPETQVPRLEKISQMFELAGFRVESIDCLDELYSVDNLRMLALLERNWKKVLNEFSKNEVETLKELLEWEKELFAKKWWAGILVVARKE